MTLRPLRDHVAELVHPLFVVYPVEAAHLALHRALIAPLLRLLLPSSLVLLREATLLVLAQFYVHFSS